MLLLGQKWAPAGPLLCIFAVQRHRPQRRTHDGLASRRSRTRRPLDAVGRLQRGFASCWHWSPALPFGVTGVAIAYTIAMFGLFVPALVLRRTPARHHVAGCAARRRARKRRGAHCGGLRVHHPTTIPHRPVADPEIPHFRSGLHGCLYRGRSGDVPGHRPVATRFSLFRNFSPVRMPFGTKLKRK